MLFMRSCYECGETQTEELSDEFAIPYLKNNEHMKLENGTIVLPPDVCAVCDQSWYEIMAHAQMIEDDRY